MNIRLYYYRSFSVFGQRFCNVLFCHAKRFHNRQANRLLTSSFRMTLFALARSVTNRRADGGPPNSSLIKITYCQQTPQNDGRRLRGIQFLPCIQWTRHEHSCPSVSIRGFLTQPFFHFANKMREGDFRLVDFRMPFLLPFEGEIAFVSICNHLL